MNYCLIFLNLIPWSLTKNTTVRFNKWLSNKRRQKSTRISSIFSPSLSLSWEFGSGCLNKKMPIFQWDKVLCDQISCDSRNQQISKTWPTSGTWFTSVIYCSKKWIIIKLKRFPFESFKFVGEHSNGHIVFDEHWRIAFFQTASKWTAICRTEFFR